MRLSTCALIGIVIVGGIAIVTATIKFNEDTNVLARVCVFDVQINSKRMDFRILLPLRNKERHGTFESNFRVVMLKGFL